MQQTCTMPVTCLNWVSLSEFLQTLSELVIVYHQSDLYHTFMTMLATVLNALIILELNRDHKTTNVFNLD